MCEILLVVTDNMDFCGGTVVVKNFEIDGIAQSTGETRADTEKVRKALTEKLQLHQDVEIERAHCTEKSGSRRPKPIVVILQPILVEFPIPSHLTCHFT